MNNVPSFKSIVEVNAATSDESNPALYKTATGASDSKWASTEVRKKLPNFSVSSLRDRATFSLNALSFTKDFSSQEIKEDGIFVSKSNFNSVPGARLWISSKRVSFFDGELLKNRWLNET